MGTRGGGRVSTIPIGRKIANIAEIEIRASPQITLMSADRERAGISPRRRGDAEESMIGKASLTTDQH